MTFYNALYLHEPWRSAGGWILYHPLIYNGQVDRFRVPAGFVTDLASVPRILWSILPPFGRYVAALEILELLDDNV